MQPRKVGNNLGCVHFKTVSSSYLPLLSNKSQPKEEGNHRLFYVCDFCNGSTVWKTNLLLKFLKCSSKSPFPFHKQRYCKTNVLNRCTSSQNPKETSGGSKGYACPLLGLKSFIFMQFSETFCQMIGWCTTSGVATASRKSLIHHRKSGIFFLNVFNEFSVKNVVKKGSNLPPVCVRNQNASTVPTRHRWETRSLNWTQFMLQWFIIFPKFAEIAESSPPLRN